MRRIILIIMCLVAATPAGAATTFQSNEDFSKWLTYYYLKPEPNRVPDAVRYMSETGFLDNGKAAPPIFGFLAGTLQSNPDKMALWISQLSSLNERHLSVVVLGVWYAALPESQKTAYALIESHPKLKSDFEFLYGGTPMSIEQIPLEQGSWVLDALWGKFIATGDSSPVKRIISTLPWIDVKGDINRLLVGGAARWSLTSNAVQHKRVFEICEEAEKREGAEVAVKLREVISNAKKELETKHDAAVDSDAKR